MAHMMWRVALCGVLGMVAVSLWLLMSVPK